MLAGVMLNKIFPDWTLALLLTLLLAFLTNRVLQRGLRMWRSESAARARAQGPAAGVLAAGSSAAAEDSQAHANGAGQPGAQAGGAADAARVDAKSGLGSGRAYSTLQRAGSAAALVAFWAAFAGAQACKSLAEPCSLAFAGLSAAQARAGPAAALCLHG